jgi:hypothetical protein
MEKIHQKQNLNNFSKIPYSKASINKEKFKLSIPFSKQNNIKLRNDSIKDTLEGSMIEAQTINYLKYSENIQNSKITNKKNNSLGKLDSKSNDLFTYSLKNLINQRNKSYDISEEYMAKAQEDYSENISSSEDNFMKLGEKKSLYNNDEDTDNTNKIDYRYYPRIPEIEGNVDKNNTLYWLATYDKLMKKSKIMKILSYYSDTLSQRDAEIFVIEDANSDYKKEENKARKKILNEKYNFKEKTMVIKDYEIYFVKKHGKPFVRQKKGAKCFMKLYLLSLEQINQIFSYINRLEYKKYINNLDSFKQKNTFRIINNFNKTIYNYTKIYCLGSFMNINIYIFSHLTKNKENESENNNVYSANYLINNLPSSNKIAKIIKVLMINFPEFSKQYFIDYLMKPQINIFSLNNHDLDLLKQKMNEVNSLLITDNKNNLKNSKINDNNTNNIIKKTIREIPTNSLSSKNKLNDLNTINFINDGSNCSDFLSNIKNELAGITNYTKKTTNTKIPEEQAKKSNTGKIKSNNTVLTRNKRNYFDKFNNNSCVNSNNETKINNQNDLNRIISLLNPIKKSLTRNNSKSISYYINKSHNKNNEKQINNIIKLDKNVLHRNKENDINLLNKNYTEIYNTGDNNFIYNNNTKAKKINKINNEQNKTEPNNNSNFNIYRNNIYSPYYTNINLIEKNSYSRTNSNSIKLQKSSNALSTMQKQISNKINRVQKNTLTNSTFMINKNSCNNSRKMMQNKRYGNDYSNNILDTKKQTKMNSMNNSNFQNKNKASDYITPLKKKFFLYYH